MEKRRIGYVVLNTCDELMDWQRANEHCDIVAILPIVSGLKMQFGQVEGSGSSEVGVFVTFLSKDQ